MLERTNLSLLFALGLVVTAACTSDETSRDDDSEQPDAAPTSPGNETPDASTGEPPPPDSGAMPDAGAPNDGGNSEPPPDAGDETDGGDPGSDPDDAGTDPDLDAGPGGEHDAGQEPPPSDSGVPDGGMPDDDAGEPNEDPFAACPTADSVTSDPEWPLTLEVTEDAVYCATFNETRTLQEELAAKMQLRLTPGTYRLPASEQADVALPACLWPGAGDAVPASAGETRYSVFDFDGSSSHSLSAQATFAPAGEQLLRLRFDRTTSDQELPGFIMDGLESGLDFDAYHSLELCDVPGVDCFPDRIFESCAYESGLLNLHEVSLESGQVAFELRLGDSFAGTEPGAYVRASGVFDGYEFDQTDYFKLVYHPTHHHFERTFAVLFDEPVGEVCGLEVTALEPFGDDVPDQAFTVDCELNRIDELTVTAHELTRE